MGALKRSPVVVGASLEGGGRKRTAASGQAAPRRTPQRAFYLVFKVWPPLTLAASRTAALSELRRRDTPPIIRPASARVAAGATSAQRNKTSDTTF